MAQGPRRRGGEPARPSLLSPFLVCLLLGLLALLSNPVVPVCGFLLLPAPPSRRPLASRGARVRVRMAAQDPFEIRVSLSKSSRNTEAGVGL